MWSTSQLPSGPSDFQFPQQQEPRQEWGRGEKRRRQSPLGPGYQPLALLPPSRALAGGLHNGPPRSALARFPPPSPRSTSKGTGRSGQHGGTQATQEADSGSQVESWGTGFRALGSERSGESPQEGRAKPTARWGGVPSRGRRLRVASLCRGLREGGGGDGGDCGRGAGTAAESRRRPRWESVAQGSCGCACPVLRWVPSLLPALNAHPLQACLPYPPHPFALAPSKLRP